MLTISHVGNDFGTEAGDVLQGAGTVTSSLHEQRKWLMPVRRAVSASTFRQRSGGTARM